MKKLSRNILTLTAVLFLVSCDPSYNSYNVSDVTDSNDETTGDNPIVTTPEINPEEEDVPKVCDAVIDRLEMNLEATLSILNDAFSKAYNQKNHLSFYMDQNNITPIRENFLVEQIDITPRYYNQGVPHLEHESIIDPRTEEELSEYYTISYNGYMHTESSTYEGTYQIGLLSDDGAILNLNGTNIIDKPYDHAPTFNCAADTVTFNSGAPVSLKLDYHQGPRTRVANTLMWRKVDANGIDKSKCEKGQYSIDSLEDNGWEIIPADVLYRDIKTCNK
ncbi:MAG: hypothetical protein ACJAS4_002835 [Bacteriovoracaceae bacterium]|jgi:hypothetical protein